MSAALLATATRWLAEGRAAQVVLVLSSRGSVPREAGTRMLVGPDAVAGTIGGGHLEHQAIALARERLQRNAVQPLEQPIALGPTLGQCCGGTLVLRYGALDAEALAAWPRALPRFELQLFGAGHVGRAVAHLLEGFDCRVQWIDEREAEFPDQPSPPHVVRVCVDAPEAEVRLAAPGTCFLILTHQHELDLRICEAVLRRGDFRFCGLIGSATKRARFIHHFERRGVVAEAVARLVCPIGITGIEGKEPEVLAVAVVAQLLQQCPPR
ncbi:xanthine dehydrogenase accessory protein XdhC [Rivibacter subsaxonicus]|uniref:Molybdenum cofactor sulfurylase n=1 Tax=Rivibacter subsaxonicus TaxID=457575 RepID=A0A4Q7VZU6_9BURK|nr:xanthine dehydrogenase accessory protein XdhC [Rivibacter subsaxonicus]RZU02444.1 molybdenum cofactor sulfurylase [Rivibacter subsaxonicus]